MNGHFYLQVRSSPMWLEGHTMLLLKCYASAMVQRLMCGQPESSYTSYLVVFHHFGQVMNTSLRAEARYTPLKTVQLFVYNVWTHIGCLLLFSRNTAGDFWCCSTRSYWFWFRTLVLNFWECQGSYQKNAYFKSSPAPDCSWSSMYERILENSLVIEFVGKSFNAWKMH